jgi:hypothetical protein
VAADTRWHQGDADRRPLPDVGGGVSPDVGGGVSPDVAAVRLDQLPLATLVLAGDGTAVQANQAWAALSAGAPETADDDGWAGLLAPADRGAFEARLRAAAQAGQAGSAEVRLAGPGAERTSFWWWRPGPAGQLVVCVAEVDGLVPRGSDDLLDVLALVVHRLFGIGLEAQCAAGLVDGSAAGRLQQVVDDLDELIRDARSMAFERLRGPGRAGLAGVAGAQAAWPTTRLPTV